MAAATRTPAKPTAPAADTPADLAARLESLLSALIGAHQQMLALTEHHRLALSRADGDAVQRCILKHSEHAAQVSSLDAERRQIVAALAGPGTPRNTPVTITTVAQCLPEPARGRIVSLAMALRELLVRLQRETAVIKAATQSLVSHMDGLMQQVARALSQARLYGPGGRIDPGGPVACGLDLTH